VRGTLYPFTIRKKAWKKWLYYKLITRNDLKTASVIHYTTQDELEKCHSFLGLKNRAFVAPNIIDLAEYANPPIRNQFRNRYQISQDKKIVLFLGRIHWIKGLDTLIPAFAKVLEKEPWAILVLAGGDDNGYKKIIEELIKKYNLGRNIIFTGMIIGKEKLAALEDSDVFVLPSYSENFGQAVVEAMACGTAVVVAKNVGIAPSIKQADAGIVIDKDEKQLAEAILKILANPSLAKEMGQRGRHLVETEFSSSAVSDKFIEICKGII
ncbi:MAG: glycosyltransferase, partial [Patescibacteria group bacterium]